MSQQLETSRLEGDAVAAVRFLQTVHPDGPWALTCIDPDTRRIETRTFAVSEVEDVHAWLLQWMPSRNIYYHVNVVAKRCDRKATKDDITEVRFLHVDIDPRAGESFDAERARILALLERLSDQVPAPTYIVDSGGGYQALWRLERPLTMDAAKADDAERYNRHLELFFEADACHDISRILRLPGTVNRPDKRKRAKGRVEALAALVGGSGDAVSLELFKQAPPVPCAGGGGSASVVDGGAAIIPVAVDDVQALPIPDWARVLIVQGSYPDEPNRYPSRSEAVFAASCEMVRAGLSDEQVAGVLLNRDFKISESIRDKKSAAGRYAARQVQRARFVVASDFERSSNGVALPTSTNLRLAIARMGVELTYNEFSGERLIEHLAGVGPRLDDVALNRLHIELSERPASDRVRFGYDAFCRIVEDAARRNAFHPVRDYFDSLEWDGEPRLDTWLIRLGGADDVQFNREVGAKQLIGAVRRVFEPGAKHDEMLVLEGPQGCGKSRSLRALAVRDEWFGEGLPLNATDPRQVVEAIEGKLIIEAAELSGLRAADVEALKAMLSRQFDEARPAYARTTRRVPRQSIFFGSTNRDTYLQDPSGGRRFYPVRVTGFDVEALVAERDQLWAEAVARYRAGEDNHLDARLFAVAAEVQEARRERDPWEEVLRTKLGEDPGKIRSEDVWRLLGVETGRQDPRSQKRVGVAMKALGFRNSRQRYTPGGGLEPGYVRGDAEGAAIFSVRAGSAGLLVERSAQKGGASAFPF